MVHGTTSGARAAIDAIEAIYIYQILIGPFPKPAIAPSSESQQSSKLDAQQVFPDSHQMQTSVFSPMMPPPHVPQRLFFYKRRPCEVKISMYGVDDPDVVQIGSPENYHATDSD